MPFAFGRSRRSAAGALLIAGFALSACAEAVTTSAPAPALPPAFADLAPELQRALAQPVSPEATAGRPATEEDLRMVERWFEPGELPMLIALSNRRAVAAGADTLPHCLPRCPHPADARQ